jgi:TRAP-type C4-dicarboxylate transport system permease small subunit
VPSRKGLSDIPGPSLFTRVALFKRHFIMKKMSTANLAEKLITTVGSTFTLIIALVIGLQIFTRTFFNRPFPWPEELSQVLLITIVFLGTGIAEKYDHHIKVEFIFDRVSRKTAIAISLVGRLLTLFFIICMLLGETSLLPRIMPLKTPAARIPVYYLHILILMGFGFWIFYIFLSLKKLIQSYRSEKGQSRD